MSTEQDLNKVAGGGSALNVELDSKRLDVDIKHLRIDNAQLQYALEQSETIVDDLAQLVKRLVNQLLKAAPDNELSEKALDYLKLKKLCGSPLRDVSNAKQAPIQVYNTNGKNYGNAKLRKDAKLWCDLADKLNA